MRSAMEESGHFEDLMCLDGIHPNQEGYRFMADIWIKAIPELKKEF